IQLQRLLLSRGANIEAREVEGWTPLHAAAGAHRINAIRVLIDSGANLLAVNDEGNMPYDLCDDDRVSVVIENSMAERGITQKMIEVEREAGEKVMLRDMKWLYRHGVSLDKKMPDGSTYLHIAAAYGFKDVAVFLLRNRVDPNAADKDQWTPVHAAAAWAHPEILELLCYHGGNINAKTKHNEYPFDLCGDDVNTKQVITQLLKHSEAFKRRKPGGCGVRDSRRSSRRIKQFESPGQPGNAEKNGFSARGAIRRNSLREKTGLTPARLEAQMMKKDIMR
ncbi:hypothetical protein PENTCL1PPCAC_5296, partial [Pristionchus entomophagus]